MASAAEQLAANINFGAFSKATELKNRIWFTLGALIIYRLGTYIPLPGIDPQVAGRDVPAATPAASSACSTCSRAARSAHDDLRAEHHALHLGLDHRPAADRGRRRSSRRSRRKARPAARSSTSTRAIGTVFLAAVQAYGIAVGLESLRGAHRARGGRSRALLPPHHGRHADRRHHVPDVARRADHRARRRQRHLADHLLRHRRAPAGSAWRRSWSWAAPARSRPSSSSCSWSSRSRVITFIVFMERAQRRILVQYPKRQVGNKMFGGEASHLPLKLNTSGVIPPIFASSLLLLPATHRQLQRRRPGRRGCAEISAISATASRSTWSLYVALIIFFCFFYTAIVFNPTETADNLRKYGGFVPGIRPGQEHRRLSRLRADPAHRGRRALSRRRSASCRRS